jgi:hypothetical protein
MQMIEKKSRLILLIAGMVLLAVLGAPRVNAQLVDPRSDKPVAVQVKRTVTVKHRRVVTHVTIRAALLSVEVRLYTVNSADANTPTNLINVFPSGSRLRIGVRTNQSGYLYIIRQPSLNEDGEIVFPDVRVNSGQNRISKSYDELILPQNCSPPFTGANCSLLLLPPLQQTGQEIYSFIFTRDLTNELLQEVLQQATQAGGKLKADYLKQAYAKSGSGKNIKVVDGKGEYWMRIVNVNPRDNDEIIYPAPLNKSR